MLGRIYDQEGGMCVRPIQLIRSQPYFGRRGLQPDIEESPAVPGISFEKWLRLQ